MGNFKIILCAFLIGSILCSCKEEVNTTISNTKSTSNDSKKEVLLIGTFHYNNPGADVVKTKSFDILKDESQQELDFIASKINKFKPTKIYVEWDYDEQTELDSIYKLYNDDNYFTNADLSDFYKKNEIFQLAFRVGKLGELGQINGIDYKTEFPFDSLMVVLEKNRQIEIQSRIGEMIEIFTVGFDNKIEKGASLRDLTYYLNTPELRDLSNEFHSEMPLVVGSKENFIGPFLTSEWYKRNLYMWSLIQKGVENEDQRIMVLVGASHAAILKNFIDDNKAWEIVELKAIIEN